MNNQQNIANQNLNNLLNMNNQNTQYVTGLANSNQNAYNQQANQNQQYYGNMMNNNLQYEKNLKKSYGDNLVNSLAALAGVKQSAATQEQQNNNQAGATIAGLLATIIPLLASDERLKNYRECSKKVVVRSPKSIQSLKYVVRGE